jgi:hypothetical protein
MELGNVLVMMLSQFVDHKQMNFWYRSRLNMVNWSYSISNIKKQCQPMIDG